MIEQPLQVYGVSGCIVFARVKLKARPIAQVLFLLFFDNVLINIFDNFFYQPASKCCRFLLILPMWIRH